MVHIGLEAERDLASVELRVVVAVERRVGVNLALVEQPVLIAVACAIVCVAAVGNPVAVAVGVGQVSQLARVGPTVAVAVGEEAVGDVADIVAAVAVAVLVHECGVLHHQSNERLRACRGSHAWGGGDVDDQRTAPRRAVVDGAVESCVGAVRRDRAVALRVEVHLIPVAAVDAAVEELAREAKIGGSLEAVLGVAGRKRNIVEADGDDAAGARRGNLARVESSEIGRRQPALGAVVLRERRAVQGKRGQACRSNAKT